MSTLGRLIEIVAYGSLLYFVGRAALRRLKHLRDPRVSLKKLPKGYRLEVTWA